MYAGLLRPHLALLRPGPQALAEFERRSGLMTRSVRAAAGVVIGEAGEDIRRQADIEVRLGVGTLESVDESLVVRHGRRKATQMPKAEI